MFTLFSVSIFFLLSLIGAIVLFKFFKSSAVVKGERYQAGGAIAGFIILYVIMYSSYYNIEKSKYSDIINDYNSLNKRLELKGISGVITPYRENTKIVLAIKETDPDRLGKFRLKASCLDPSNDDIRLYIINENGYLPVSIYSEEDMANLKIPIDLIDK